MCALGLNIVVGYAGLLDLGYVAFWAIGGYIAGWLMSELLLPAERSTGSVTRRPSAAGHPHQLLGRADRGGLLCAICGIIIGAPTLRLKSDYLALVTLGFGEIIPQVFHNGDKHHIGVNLTNGTKGISPVDKISGPTFDPNGGIGRGPLGPFDGSSRYIFLIVLPRSSCSSRCGSATAGSAGPGSRSARTSSRPA